MRLHPSGCLAATVALLLGAAGALGQSTFRNLGFESARIIPDPSSYLYPYAVNGVSALPGWNFTPPSGGYSNILYNTVSLGAAAFSIHDNDSGDSMYPVMEGRYWIGLQGADQGPGTAAIWQTGQVPIDAQALTFWGILGSLQITFNGQFLPYVPIGSGVNSTIYGTDISMFTGQVGELRFSAMERTGGLIDNIQFSNQPIPEPAVFSLSALGALLFGWRFLRRQRCQGMPNFCCSECAGHVSVSIGSPRRRIAERIRYA